MKKGAVTLFEAAGLADSAPRPLADRLRPASLAEVIGQDHLLGEQGMLVAHGQGGAALLGDLLGTAGHRQDHRGAAARRGHRSSFRAALGHPFRRLGFAQGVRRRQSAPRGGPRHAAVRRRDPPLQPLASRTPSCRIWKTAPSFWWAPPPRIRSFELNSALLSRASVLTFRRLDDQAIEALLAARRGA